MSVAGAESGLMLRVDGDRADAPIGILAGGGELPGEIVAAIEAAGGSVEIVSLAGEADAAFEGRRHVRVGWGEVGRMMSTFRAAGCRDLVIIGSVTRPDLWRLAPDLGLLVRLPSIAAIVTAGGDDGVLRRVVRVFEREGFQVRGPDDVAPALVGRGGPIAGPPATAGQIADGRLGFAVVAALGRHDVGQAVVVAGGRVIALEGAEGTDRLLRGLAGRADTRGGVLIKRPKPAQELRIDLPAIGPDTVTHAAAAGLAAIILEADRVLIAGRDAMAARAVAAGIAVHGMQAASLTTAVTGSPVEDAPPPLPPPPLPPLSWRARVPFSRAAARHQLVRDAAQGRQVMRALAAFGCGDAIVVSRRHVLAVSGAETCDEVLARVATLRQWGEAASRARRGVLVCRAGGIAYGALAAASAAGLAGIDIVDADAAMAADVAARVAVHGLILLAAP